MECIVHYKKVNALTFQKTLLLMALKLIVSLETNCTQQLFSFVNFHIYFSKPYKILNLHQGKRQYLYNCCSG